MAYICMYKMQNSYLHVNFQIFKSEAMLFQYFISFYDVISVFVVILCYIWPISIFNSINFLNSITTWTITMVIYNELMVQFV